MSTLQSHRCASRATHFRGGGMRTACASRTAGSTIFPQLQYSYGPFGEVIRQTGPMAKVNPFRFSTQYQDDETDLVCYLHRYYSPSTGRWLSKDPIAEKGGLNLYTFVRNDGVNRSDKYGLAGWVWGNSSIVDYSIAYDTSMSNPSYGPPTDYQSGTWGAEQLAKAQGGLNDTLFQHYLHGRGATMDLTSDATLKGEVTGALATMMDAATSDIRKQVESFKCPVKPNLFGISASFLGDNGFTAIDRNGFTSSVWVIRKTQAGLSKKCNALVLCSCKGPILAITTCDFHMYFYDQFADAADLFHKDNKVTEWVGGTQFDEIGAWGRVVTQSGVYK